MKKEETSKQKLKWRELVVTKGEMGGGMDEIGDGD